MSKKFIMIKTSGGIVTDVWKGIQMSPSAPSEDLPYWLAELFSGVLLRITGEVTLLEFESGKAESEKEYAEYIEYHSVLDAVSYNVRIQSHYQTEPKKD